MLRIINVLVLVVVVVSTQFEPRTGIDACQVGYRSIRYSVVDVYVSRIYLDFNPLHLGTQHWSLCVLASRSNPLDPC